jgi:hypothetical protein
MAIQGEGTNSSINPRIDSGKAEACTLFFSPQVQSCGKAVLRERAQARCKHRYLVSLISRHVVVSKLWHEAVRRIVSGRCNGEGNEGSMPRGGFGHYGATGCHRGGAARFAQVACLELEKGIIDMCCTCYKNTW